MGNPFESPYESLRQSIIDESKKKAAKRQKRWQDDDGDNKWYEKSDVDGKISDREKKEKEKNSKKEVKEADSLSGQVDRWEAARQKRMKQRQSYERPHWIPRDQDHEDNWGSSKGEKRKPQKKNANLQNEEGIADIIARLEKKRISKGGDAKDSPLPSMRKYHADKKKKVKEAYEVSNADKKGNTKAWQGYQSGQKSRVDGKPLYKAGAGLTKEDTLIETAVDYFISEGINEEGIDLIIEDIGIDTFTDFVLDFPEQLDEERKARRATKRNLENLKTKTIPAAKAKEAKRQSSGTGEYKSSKKKPKLGAPSYVTAVKAGKKKAVAKKKVAVATKKAKAKQPAKKATKQGLLGKVKGYVKKGVAAHNKARAAGKVPEKRVKDFAKGFASGVSGTVKFAKKAKKALTDEYSSWRDEIGFVSEAAKRPKLDIKTNVKNKIEVNPNVKTEEVSSVKKSSDVVATDEGTAYGIWKGDGKGLGKPDYHRGTGEKVVARTQKWMKGKGQKGAPGLNAMKARTAEHEARRGVKKEETELDERLGGKGYSRRATGGGGDWPDSDRGGGHKSVKRAGGTVKKKSPTYLAYVHNKSKDPSKKEDSLPTTFEARVDQGRSDYGKATIRNWRHSGPKTVDPAMFDPDNKRGKTIDKRREEHKARRGVKGAKVPTYKKEEFELEEERSARKMNVRTKKTIQTTIAKNAAAEAKRKEKKTGEYKETPKKKPKLGLGYTTVVKHAQAKKAAAKKTPITRATAKKAEKKTAPSTKSVARTKAQYKGEGAPGLDAHKERIAKHEAKRGVKKPKAAKKTPVTKATTTKPAPKKAAARKSVTSTPITKAASTPKKKKTFGEFVKQGVKRHRKATQGARVFGKGFAKGVKKSVKFAKDVKKVVTNEQVNRISKMVKAIRRKKEVLKQPTMDHTTKKLHKWRKDKEQEEREKYVSPFKPIDYND